MKKVCGRQSNRRISFANLQKTSHYSRRRTAPPKPGQGTISSGNPATWKIPEDIGTAVAKGRAVGY
jgi:hypothetical protein